jgi:regulator of PEP synthase PpsR (kinase-PPPase family)
MTIRSESNRKMQINTPRDVFIISDGTGITAETFSQSILAQFEISFRIIRKPFINTLQKASQVVIEINNLSEASNIQPIVFTTLVKPEINQKISQARCIVIDMFKNFISPLEEVLQLKSNHTIGLFHHNANTQSYKNRIHSINYSLAHDDGQASSNLENAEIILVGVSRSGKTPTCLYLAVQFGMRTANYPLTPEDLESNELPNDLLKIKDKVFGLTIDPVRLSEIRHERLPNSNYASLQNCKFEVKKAESLLHRNNIEFLSVTNKSIEEVASTLLQKFNPEIISTKE